jgi:hypothetical protein
MEIAKQGLNILDTYKEKITDKEYKDMCDLFQKMASDEYEISEKEYTITIMYPKIDTFFSSCEATRFVPFLNFEIVKTHLKRKKCSCVQEAVCEHCKYYKYFTNLENKGKPYDVSVECLKTFLVDFPILNFEHGRFSYLYAHNNDSHNHCDMEDEYEDKYNVVKVNFHIPNIISIIVS